jgi:hypothetical protein
MTEGKWELGVGIKRETYSLKDIKDNLLFTQEKG